MAASSSAVKRGEDEAARLPKDKRGKRKGRQTGDEGVSSRRKKWDTEPP